MSRAAWGTEPDTFNLLSRTVISETDCSQLTQDKCLTHQFLDQDKSRLASPPHLACFWIPQHDHFQPACTFRNFPVFAPNRRGPCWRTGTLLHGNTESACYSKDGGQRTGHLCVNTGSNPRAGEVQGRPHLCNFLSLSWPSTPTASGLAGIYSEYKHWTSVES